jgi:ATP-binding cassette subfamily F protein uup
VDHVFVLTGDGEVKDILGNYDSYRKWEDEQRNAQRQPREETPIEKPVEKKPTVPKNKPSFKDKFEWDQLEKEIPVLESKKKELEAQLLDVVADHERLQKVSEELGQVIQSLDAKSLRWLELSEWMMGES